MTRQEKRRKQNKKVTLTVKELEDIRIKSLDEGFMLALGLPIIVLHEEFGYGNKTRIPKFTDLVLKRYSDLLHERLTLNEVVQQVNHITGNNILEGR